MGVGVCVCVCAERKREYDYTLHLDLCQKVTLCMTVTVGTMCTRESQLCECAVRVSQTAKNIKDGRSVMMQTKS